MVRCRVKHNRDCSVSEWSGGTTTELYIHPESAAYADRDFEFRISSATVQLDESDFTPLPGYRRHIMPLSGSMRLVYEGSRTVFLREFESDSFEGEWNTKSYGKCTDFNLMHRSGWRGAIRPMQSTGIFGCAAGYTALYTLKDALTVNVMEKSGTQVFSQMLDRRDFLMVEADADVAFDIACDAGGDVSAVLVRVERCPDIPPALPKP